MASPVLNIVCGTDIVDLLKFLDLKSFGSSVVEPKDGGIWGSSPFAEGRVPIDMEIGNMIVEMLFGARGADQDEVAIRCQEVRKILENARNYWLATHAKTPAYLEKRGSTETNTSYAIIYDYRAPGTGNPFAAPLFGPGDALSVFPLVLETTPWQSVVPGSSTCVEIDNIQAYGRGNIDNHFHIETSHDDAWVRASTVALEQTTIELGMSWTLPTRYGMIFRSVNIPKDALITAAFIRFTSSGVWEDDPVNLRILGERHSCPCGPEVDCECLPEYTTSIAEFNARLLTDNYVDWDDVAHWAQDVTYDSPDISNIIIELISSPEWQVRFSEIAIQVIDNGSDYWRKCYAYDMGSGSPELHISYVDTKDYGRTATCEKEVFIGNKHNKAQITEIFRYDDDAVGDKYTDLIEAGWPQALFPDPPGVGDALLIGSDSAIPDAGPFRNIIVDILTGMYGISLSISYSTTAAWATPDHTTDNTKAFGEIYTFGATGVNSYHFSQHLDFDHRVINGKDCWWIKFEVTAVGADFQVPIQQNRDIYTIVTPYFTIEADQVPGELPLLARTQLFSRAYSATGLLFAYPKKIYLASRKLSRGEEFSPYLNAANIQMPSSGINYYIYGAQSTIVEDKDVIPATMVDNIGSPAGRMTVYDTSGAPVALGVQAAWVFNYIAAKQYAGRYAVYIRGYKDAGTDDILCAVRVGYGNPTTAPILSSYYQTKTVHIGSDFATYIDTISIMEDIVEDETVYSLFVAFMLGIEAAAPTTLFYVYDLVLVPIDEFLYICDSDPSPFGNSYYNYSKPDMYLDIDPIGNPKVFRSGVYIERTGDRIANMNRSSRNPWSLNRDARQRVWYFSPTDIDIANAVKQFAVSRYFDLRGNK